MAILSCQQETGNIHDLYTVAVVNDGAILGHVYLQQFVTRFFRRTERKLELESRWWKSDMMFEMLGLSLPTCCGLATPNKLPHHTRSCPLNFAIKTFADSWKNCEICEYFHPQNFSAIWYLIVIMCQGKQSTKVHAECTKSRQC